MIATHPQAFYEANRAFSIIGIGTSAGGLEALKNFLSHIPEDFEHSLVIIQHLSSDYKSLMPELLAKSSPLQIYEVHETTPIVGSSIYLIPPKSNLILKDGTAHADQ